MIDDIDKTFRKLQQHPFEHILNEMPKHIREAKGFGNQAFVVWLEMNKWTHEEFLEEENKRLNQMYTRTHQG